MASEQIGFAEFADVILRSSWGVKSLLFALCLLALKGLIGSNRETASRATSNIGQTLPQPQSGAPLSLSDELTAELKGLLLRNQKIEAIKRLRQVTGSDLKSAKDAVDAIDSQMSRH